MPGEKHIERQRKQARHRKRRIIFNNDGGDIDRAGAQTREALLELRTSALVGSQVDTVCYNAVKLFHGVRWAWNAGVDGVYMFNFFDPHLSLWREVGDRETLGGLDKDFYANVLGFWGRLSAAPVAQGRGSAFCGCRRSPRTGRKCSKPGKHLKSPLPSEKTSRVEPLPAVVPRSDCNSLWRTSRTLGDVHVALNGTPLSGGILREGLQTEVPCRLIRQYNKVAMTLAAGMAAPVTIHDLMLSIRYN